MDDPYRAHTTGTSSNFQGIQYEPLCWPLGVVVETYPGKDGLVIIYFVIYFVLSLEAQAGENGCAAQ